jgi:hypothetical protein
VLLVLAWTVPLAAQPTPTMSFEPTDRYEVRRIEGWRVLVNRGFVRDEAERCDDTLKVLGHQLFNIERHVPPEPVVKLKRVTIWVESREPHHPCMCYHPDAGWLTRHGMNPEKARCVEVANAENFLKWSLEQPWMVLHELAHAYHHQFLPGGFDNADVLDAYRQAKEAKLYDAVLPTRGKPVRAYAMTDAQEFFAETSESFFGTNDFYPFVRAELRQHDPPTFALLKRLWGEK